VARKKRNAPFDPAEAARKAAEKAHRTRHNPGDWEVNREALGLPQNANVTHEGATRTKTARVYRWDCFSLLASRGGLSHDKDEAAAKLAGVRRFEETLAQRMRLEGTQGNGIGGGRPIPISDRSVSAAQTVEFLQGSMRPFLFGLLEKLVSPAVQNGHCVNNWRKVVEEHSGEFRHTEQGKLVSACAGDLLTAWQAWDNRERKAA
jgi:hypothetical protein